jgi:hypothetical protein
LLSRNQWVVASRVSFVAAVVVIVGGCTLTPEERLRWDLSDEIYATAARECANQYHTVRVTRVAVNGDVQGDTAADSKSEIRAFSTCYWDGIETRQEAAGEGTVPSRAIQYASGRRSRLTAFRELSPAAAAP